MKSGALPVQGPVFRFAKMQDRIHSFEQTKSLGQVIKQICPRNLPYDVQHAKLGKILCQHIIFRKVHTSRFIRGLLRKDVL